LHGLHGLLVGTEAAIVTGDATLEFARGDEIVIGTGTTFTLKPLLSVDPD
jgi:hypothetical protein